MTSADTTASAAFGELFSGAAVAYPDRIALLCSGRRIEYGALGTRVDDAGGLLGGGPRPLLIRVPSAADSAAFVDAVVTILAAIAGARPIALIDDALPDERVRVLTASAQTALPGCSVLMFTSGSTGVPKAVRQGPAQWRQQVVELGRHLDLGPGVTVMSALPISFGGGLEVALTALAAGATLLPVDARGDGVDGLVRTLTARRPDQLHLSPHLLRTLCAHRDAPVALASVSLVSTCGEAPDAADLAALRAAAPHVTFLNRAGSSETGHLAFDAYPPDRVPPEGTLIPGPIADGKKLLVRDDEGRLLGEGEIGRIEVVSPYLAEGYLVDGEAVDFPLDENGHRHYVLGDLGAVDSGELRFAGRADDAVKIRGYLVDVSEVTAAARSVSGIVDVAVIARTGTAARGRTDIVAYLVPDPTGRPPSVAAIRAHLAQRLPDWMQPAHVVLLPELPRSDRGKLDRQALPAPAARPEYRAPSTRTERLLAPIWEDLLGVPRVGRDDDFTSLGGDSLTAVDLLGRIEESFGVRLPLPEVTAAGSMGGVAAVIDGASDRSSSGAELAELSGAGAADRPIVFAFAGAGESAHAFLPLARRLPAYRVIGVTAHALERRGVPDYTVGRAVRRALRQVRGVSPRGPYRFVGHSLGGVIAMETARRLAAGGATVEHVVCLDTVLDDALRRGSPIDFPAPAEGTRAAGPDPSEEVAGAANPWRTRIRLLTAGWWPRPAAEQWSLFHELGRRSALLHRLRPWAGPVTLIKADENEDPDQWWALVAPGTAQIHRVRGDHSAMLRPPYVAATAERVAAALGTGARETGAPV